MKKSFIGAFIAADLLLITGSASVLYTYVHHVMSGRPGAALPKASAPLTESTTPTMATSKPLGNVPPTPAAANDNSSRNILFKYHSPHARQVSIRADFTGWKAEAMQKADNDNWTYQAQLTPGEYAYCYTADDKTFKDPMNKRTKQIGRTLVSAIVVEALPSSPPK